MTRAKVAKFREFWTDEMEAASLYRMLADLSEDAGRREVFLELARTEERHAAHWEKVLEDAGADVPRHPRRSWKVRAMRLLARVRGVDAVLPLVLRQEAGDASKYRGVSEAPSSMVAQERAHGQAIADLTGEGSAGSRIAMTEGRHRVGAGDALRPAVFGINDGLVSNFALVMGVAGGTPDPTLILLAGVAGLVAGAFSMAAGEWVSVRSQRELYEREIAMEAEELEAFPEEERRELELIYQAKGIPEDEAKALADRIMSDPDTALDALVREELGLDPEELGSAWVAAGSSFVAFALGAVVPVIPYLIGTGTAALWSSAAASAATLFLVGAVLSLFTGKSAPRSGLRMVSVGALAAAITYAIGNLVGVSLG